MINALLKVFARVMLWLKWYSLYFFVIFFVFATIFLIANIYLCKDIEKDKGYHKVNTFCIFADVFSVIMLFMIF